MDGFRWNDGGWLVVLGWGLFGFSSLVLVWQDFVKKRISLWVLLLMMGVGGGLLFFRERGFFDVVEWWVVRSLGAMVPSVILGVAALRAKAGWGDVVVAFFCGWWTGIFEMAWWLLLSVGLAWGEVVVRFLRGEKVRFLPFVTWMLVGFWVWLGIQWILARL